MSAYEIGAIQDKGINVVMKHYALNDSEQDRIDVYKRQLSYRYRGLSDKGDNAERGTKACTISVCKVQSLVYRESDACVRSERQHCSCRWKQAGDQQAE